MKGKRAQRKKPTEMQKFGSTAPAGVDADVVPTTGTGSDTASMGMLDNLVTGIATDANASVQNPSICLGAGHGQQNTMAPAANGTGGPDILSGVFLDTLVDKLVMRLVGGSGQNSQQYTPQRAEEAIGQVLSNLCSPNDTQNQRLGNLARNGQVSSHIFQRSDVQYNRQELENATTVIKEIMKMDAAGPFNVPVDTSGIPDYLDIIDTPMDFSMIYTNLQNRLKYMTAEDVLKDVELIWDNCQRYNKESDPILILMKQVRKRFMKRWAASGLSRNQQRGTISGPSLVSKSNRLVSGGSVKPSPALQPQGQMDTSQLHYLEHHISPLRYTQPHLLNFSKDMAQTSRSQHHLDIDFAGPAMRRTSSATQQQDTYLSSNVGNSQWSQDRSTRGKLQPQGRFFDQANDSRLNEKQILSTEPVADEDSHESDSDASILNDDIGQQKQNIVEVGSITTQTLPMNYIQSSGCQPNDFGSDDHSSESLNKKKGSRGPTELRSFWKSSAGNRIAIPSNETGEPVGPMAGKLSTFLGTIARNGELAPLTYTTWRKVPIEKKELMWEIVQSKFDADPTLKTWVLKKIGSNFRNWKSLLKSRHYYTHLTHEERLADRDKRVSPNQWEYLISFWNSEENQKISEKNRANGSKQIARHTTGRKSYARLREEERAKKQGEEPTKAELFILTRTRKNGQPVDEVSSKAISQLRQLMSEQPEIVQDDANVEDIIYQTLGKKKPRPGRSSTHTEVIKMASEVKRLAEEKVNSMQEKMESMELKYEHMESLMTKMLCTIEKSSGTGQVYSAAPVMDNSTSSGLPLRLAPAPSYEVMENSTASGLPLQEAPAPSYETRETRARKRQKAIMSAEQGF